MHYFALGGVPAKCRGRLILQRTLKFDRVKQFAFWIGDYRVAHSEDDITRAFDYVAEKAIRRDLSLEARAENFRALEALCDAIADQWDIHSFIWATIESGTWYPFNVDKWVEFAEGALAIAHDDDIYELDDHDKEKLIEHTQTLFDAREVERALRDHLDLDPISDDSEEDEDEPENDEPDQE